MRKEGTKMRLLSSDYTMQQRNQSNFKYQSIYFLFFLPFPFFPLFLFWFPLPPFPFFAPPFFPFLSSLASSLLLASSFALFFRLNSLNRLFKSVFFATAFFRCSADSFFFRSSS